jgi:hypothetical protein
VTDDEILARIEAVVRRVAVLYELLEPLVWSSDADPDKVAELRNEIEHATADWYAVHDGAPRVWDEDRRSDWPAMLEVLSKADRARLEAFLDTYESPPESTASA